VSRRPSGVPIAQGIELEDHRPSGTADRIHATSLTGYSAKGLLRSMFQSFESVFSNISQPYLKPSPFRPTPILSEEKIIIIIPGIVNFAMEKNKLPQAQNRCLLNF